MSISITEGSEGRAGRAAEVAPGTRLHYTVTVTDQGGRAVSGLRIVQRLPDGAVRPEADHRGRPEPAGLTWRTGLPAHATLRFGSSAVLGRVASGQQQVASTVCAYPGSGRTPVVCGSVMNPLAAGATGGRQAELLGPDGGSMSWTVGGAGALVLLAAGGTVGLCRRRPAAAAGDPAGADGDAATAEPH
jgi:hypothetical protein